MHGFTKGKVQEDHARGLPQSKDSITNNSIHLKQASKIMCEKIRS